jgi:hypothetical protein
VYHKNLGCVDLGTLNWTKGSGTAEDGRYYYVLDFDQLPLRVKGRYVDPNDPRGACGGWTFGNVSGNAFYFLAGNSVFLTATNYANGAAFKSAMSGKLLFYELETPQIWNSKSIVGLGTLETTDKTLIGAINELKARIDAL